MTDLINLIEKLHKKHAEDLQGAITGGYDSDPIFMECADALEQVQNKLRQASFNAQGEPGHALRVEVESLRAKLEKAKEYVRHKAGCAMYTPVDASTDCNCGLSEWVKSL